MKGIVTTLILGAALTEFGITGLQPDGEPVAQGASQITAAVEQVLPVATMYAPPGMVVGSQAAIEQDVAAGVRELDQSVRKLPGYAARVAGQVEEHGIAALAYEDPETKRLGQQIGAQIGSGIRHLATALGKDLVASARVAAVPRQIN